MPILHYPKKHPVTQNRSAADGATEAIDYVKFERLQLSYDSKGTSSGYTGSSQNLPSNNAQRTAHGTVVYLAMPPALATAYNPSYRSANLGSVGANLAGAMAIGGRSGYEGIAKTIQEAARAMQPEFAQSIITGLANNLSGMMGLQGNIDANGLEALANGRVFNPYQEQLFAQMNFRQHQFSFKLYAKDPDEAQDIKKIIRWFKAGSLPEFTNGGKYMDLVKGEGWGKNLKGLNQEGKFEDLKNTGFNKDVFAQTDKYWDKLNDMNHGGAAGRRFMKIPDSFNLSFKRFGDPQNTSGGYDLHFNIKRSVCNGIQVNYTPDNQYSAFHGRPDPSGMNNPATVLALSFLEVEILGKEDVSKGNF